MNSDAPLGTPIDWDEVLRLRDWVTGGNIGYKHEGKSIRAEIVLFALSGNKILIKLGRLAVRQPDGKWHLADEQGRTLFITFDRAEKAPKKLGNNFLIFEEVNCPAFPYSYTVFLDRDECLDFSSLPVLKD